MPNASAATVDDAPAPAAATTAASGHPSAPARDATLVPWTACAVLATAEIALALAHLVLGLGLLPVAVVHVAIVAIALSRLLAEPAPGGDVTARAFIVFATAAAGPIGAIVGLAFARASAAPAAPSPLLDEWYRRIALSAEIDPVTELCDNVASGRTMNLASPVPQSFLSVMATGAIADQQTALGLIARRFHPDYLPALSRALRSPEPVIRVQAAAVVARIRDELQDRVRAHLEAFDAGRRPADATSVLGELEKAAQSGLIDETDRLRAEALIAREAARRDDATSGSGGAPSQGRAVSYKALRVARRRQRIVRAGAYRVRGLRRSRSKGDAA